RSCESHAAPGSEQQSGPGGCRRALRSPVPQVFRPDPLADRPLERQVTGRAASFYDCPVSVATGILLLLGIGFLVANLRLPVEYVRYLRRRRHAVLTWPGAKPP